MTWVILGTVAFLICVPMLLLLLFGLFSVLTDKNDDLLGD